MLVYEKTSVYLAVELSLREIYYVLYARALILRTLMMQKSCAVGMRNAKLGNRLKLGQNDLTWPWGETTLTWGKIEDSCKFKNF